MYETVNGQKRGTNSGAEAWPWMARMKNESIAIISCFLPNRQGCQNGRLKDDEQNSDTGFHFRLQSHNIDPQGFCGLPPNRNEPASQSLFSLRMRTTVRAMISMSGSFYIRCCRGKQLIRCSSLF
jgi:hypothetical protein